MAKLSRLPRRLRRCFEAEQPRTAQLDDKLLEYFAGMLEGEEQVKEDEIVEAWAHYVVDAVAALHDEKGASEMCRAVLQRLQSTGGLSRASSSSSAESHADDPLEAAGTSPLARTPSASSAEREPREARVRGLEEWLERLGLRHYSALARSWCAGNDVTRVDEIMPNWEDFCDDLSLKKLERRRVCKDCCHRADVRPEGRDAAAAPQDTSRSVTLPCPAAARASQAQRLQPQPAGAAPSSPSGATAIGRQGGFCAADGGRCDADGEQSRLLPTALSHVPPFGPKGREYTIVGEIGKGVTATVYKCTRGEEVYAAKTISKSTFRLQRDFAGMMDRLHRETAILFSLHHSHIVSLYDAVDTEDTLYLVMEYVEGGDLFNEIIRNGAMQEHEARYVFLQIVLGMRYIHSKGVVHRDLKPENVLVDRRNSRPGLLEVKISDFGHSKLVDDGYSTAISVVGTPHFCAPEVSDSCAADGYDERADLWSLGVVLYLMLEGAYPFSDGKASCELTFRSDSRLSPDARDLVQRLLQQRPHDRLPLDQCLRHRWVMTASGPLSPIVELCELREWSRHRKCERRVKLPRAPCDVKQLRRDLQGLIFGHRLPVMLRHKEVAVRFASETSVSEDEECAWEELMRTLERHYPDGSFIRPECQTLELLPLDARLATVSEEDVLVRGESSISVSSGRLDEELKRREEFIKAAREAFPNVVEAVVDHRLVDLSLRLGPWRTLLLTVTLPAGFPEVCPMQLESVSLRCPRTELGEVEGQLRERIVAHLEGQPSVPGLVELLTWLHKDVLPELARDSGVGGAPGARAGGQAQAAGADAEAGAAEAPADDGPEPEPVPAEPVKCGRLCLVTPQHDEKRDRMHPTTAPRGVNLDKLIRGHKNQSFFWHIKHMFPEVSGVMSYGKPGVLIAEGPLLPVEKLKSEVGKFTPWWPVEQKVFDVSDPVLDVAAWRAFGKFSKVKTDEVRELCEKVGQQRLYELLAAGTSLETTRDPARKKTMKLKHR